MTDTSASSRARGFVFRALSAFVMVCAILFQFTRDAAAQAWPAKPVRVIVPFAAGGSVDVTARRVADYLSRKFGQQFYVETIVGASGATGARAVAKADPDGYTLLYGTTSVFAINPAVNPNVGYDPVRNFVPVARTFDSAMMLVTHPSVPVKNVAELIAWGKANPGKLNFGSAGIGTPMHVTGEMFKFMTGVQMTHVPYTGGSQSIADIMGGHIQVLFENPLQLVPLARGGGLNMMAVTGETRNEQAPEVPTLKETGLDIVVTLIFGFAAPAGTPQPIVTTLNSAINEALRDPELLKSVASFGAEAKPGSPEDFGKFIVDELRRWSEVAKAAKIRVE